jgi:hypothetical protein
MLKYECYVTAIHVNTGSAALTAGSPSCILVRNSEMDNVELNLPILSPSSPAD